jgi:hypothetical protein
VPLCAQADQDFHGIVESRPQGPGGTWVIGGRHIEVTQPIIINEGAGPLVVGGCVSVDYEDGMIAEIDTEPASRCEQAGAR